MYLSTKDTILKVYDGRFRALFEEVLKSEFKDKYDAAKLTFEHRHIDDMVASNLKWYGGYLWVVQELRWRCPVRYPSRRVMARSV